MRGRLPTLSPKTGYRLLQVDDKQERLWLKGLKPRSPIPSRRQFHARSGVPSSSAAGTDTGDRSPIEFRQTPLSNPFDALERRRHTKTRGAASLPATRVAPSRSIPAGAARGRADARTTCTVIGILEPATRQAPAPGRAVAIRSVNSTVAANACEGCTSPSAREPGRHLGNTDPNVPLPFGGVNACHHWNSGSAGNESR